MGSEDSNELKMRRHTPDQVVRKSREADKILAEGGGIAQVLQKHGGARGAANRLQSATRRGGDESGQHDSPPSIIGRHARVVPTDA